MYKNILFLSIGLFFIGTAVIADDEESTRVRRCFQFTWLGPAYTNTSNFLNGTCEEATRLADGVPCQRPLVASYDGTWPDIDYIWRNYLLNASCILARNDVCAKFTYYFDGHVENATYMCTRAINSRGQAITSGCYDEVNGSFSTRVCLCQKFDKMYSVLTRGNAILTYTLSVLACLTFLCFLSTLTVDYRTAANMNTVKVVVKNVPDYGASRERNDLGFLTFDLKTDLSSLFNWNVKQLFLYLTAEYVTPNNELNQVVLWDKIILRGENAILDFKNMNTKYYFWDDGNGLKGHNNVTLTLSWNIIPNAGLLPNIEAIGQHSFKFPTEYTQTRV
ncbi:signal peptidase complex subunit 3 [Hyposmocoma kahamanoa]|uniref:signal peptidase complex subunit 3 n=1 Tax=Hyposmocoma kahamanoa TaxID=1477025 RepID=UPI000E6D8910|nr:signal peptidase complex subunit 3 [Hyposmocoma kahamanoa]